MSDLLVLNEKEAEAIRTMNNNVAKDLMVKMEGEKKKYEIEIKNCEVQLKAQKHIADTAMMWDIRDNPDGSTYRVKIPDMVKRAEAEAKVAELQEKINSYKAAIADLSEAISELEIGMREADERLTAFVKEVQGIDVSFSLRIQAIENEIQRFINKMDEIYNSFDVDNLTFSASVGGVTGGASANNVRGGISYPVSNMLIGDKMNCNCSVHNGKHNGVDLKPIQWRVDGDPIYAAISGNVKIVSSEDSGAAGIYIQVVSLDGKTVTQYMHLSAINIKDGQFINAGTQIAEMGTTGRSTGTHLHFGVQVDGKYVDPLEFLNYSDEN